MTVIGLEAVWLAIPLPSVGTTMMRQCLSLHLVMSQLLCYTFYYKVEILVDAEK